MTQSRRCDDDDAEDVTFNDNWRDQPEPALLVQGLRKRWFRENQIRAFLEEIDALCPHCWNHKRPCNCTRERK